MWGISCREAPSGGGSASPDIDEDPEVLVTEWDVLPDNMALMYQDAADVSTQVNNIIISLGK